MDTKEVKATENKVDLQPTERAQAEAAQVRTEVKPSERKAAVPTDPTGVKVTTLKVKEGQALIEWRDEDNTRRSWVPAKDVSKDEVAEPDRGLAYGDIDEHDIKGLPNAKAIAQALHNQGLWTWAEVKVNPQKVNAAIAQVYSNVLTMLMTKE